MGSGGTVAEQFERIMGHLNRALEDAGLRLTDITFVSVFLADLTLYQELNSAYSRSFPHKPCRAVVGAQLRNGALVEVVAEGWSDA
ncbi:RidA family protein [Roseibium sp.]|uniref:RidA family protein n=1 Tax=Roseibium sp. TaxID=1936156 RepID=UPI003A96A88F